MSEFKKFWIVRGQDFNIDEQIAKEIWDRAQIAALRTLHKPPYIPKAGEKVRILGLAHKSLLDQVCEVTSVIPQGASQWWVEYQFTTKDGEPYCSGGVLSEVEPIKQIGV